MQILMVCPKAVVEGLVIQKKGKKNRREIHVPSIYACPQPRHLITYSTCKLITENRGITTKPLDIVSSIMFRGMLASGFLKHFFYFRTTFLETPLVKGNTISESCENRYAALWFHYFFLENAKVSARQSAALVDESRVCAPTFATPWNFPRHRQYR